MSKFLKFIVNICLFAAILTAVAILVPPLIGITTTIVDTPSMNTNLPLGSVTYSTEVDVSEIEVGDEILKETGNSSSYAYIVREADPDRGVFKVVSAMDRDGSEEEIYLRNKVPKVAVMVPLIGYVLIAMHSLEGRIIVGLVVALLIILFILSELWRPVGDEDYIDEDLTEDAEEEEDREKSSVTAHEETGIDTEAIRAAVEENQSIVDSENAAEEAASGEAGASTGEVAAEVDQMLAEARSSAHGEMREIRTEELKDGGLTAGLEEDAAQGTQEEASQQGPEAKEDEASSGDAVPYADKSSADAAPEHAVPYAADLPSADAVSVEDRRDEEEKLPNNIGYDDRSQKSTGPDGRDDSDPDAAKAETAAAVEGGGEDVPADAPASPLSGEKLPEAPDDLTEQEPEAKAEGPDLVDITNEGTQLPGGRFIPTPHPTLDEILESAKNAGEEPRLIRDEATGITVVDYSKLL